MLWQHSFIHVKSKGVNPALKGIEGFRLLYMFFFFLLLDMLYSPPPVFVCFPTSLPFMCPCAFLGLCSSHSVLVCLFSSCVLCVLCSLWLLVCPQFVFIFRFFFRLCISEFWIVRLWISAHHYSLLFCWSTYLLHCLQYDLISNGLQQAITYSFKSLALPATKAWFQAIRWMKGLLYILNGLSCF